MSQTSEEFIKHYLRLNGYFSIDNFIVHAADDPNRISNGYIGNYTETDILGIRLPHSTEISGQLCIANDTKLLSKQNGSIDIVIAEVKTGNENKPNKAWRHTETINIKEYIVKFIGVLQDEDKIIKAAKKLSENFQFENDSIRIRYIIFSEKENEHYSKIGVTYITYDHVIDFIINIRGESWMNENIGVASLHQQWPSLLKDIFNIVNDNSSEIEEKRIKIKDVLDSNK